MADNVGYTPGSGTKVATDEVTYSGDTSHVGLTRLVGVTGSEGSKTVIDPPVDGTYGFGVDIKRIAAGTNNIGDVDVLTVPADPFGVNADAASSTGSISAKLRFIATVGIPITGAVTVANAGTFPVQAAGDVAHDAVDSGSPVKVGGQAQGQFTFPTAVASGDRSHFTTDLYGRQQVVIRPDDVKRLGVYYYHSGALTVTASADTAITSGGGRVWVINPVGSSVTVRIRRIVFRSQLGSALVAVTSPRFTINKGVFTGTASGASITAAKRRTADASATGEVRTASTGMTVSSSAVVCSFFPVSSATAVGYTAPASALWEPGLEDYLDLAAGECLILHQTDAGTTSDTRRVTCDFVVEEF